MGIRFSEPGDEVVGMVCVEEGNETILVVSEKGYGKRTYLNDPEDGSEVYRITNRGGKGVKTMNVTEKTGALIAIKAVTDDNDLMIINKSGITIRLAVSGIRVMGRATQGVRLINLRNDDTIAAVTSIISSNGNDHSEDESDEVAED